MRSRIQNRAHGRRQRRRQADVCLCVDAQTASGPAQASTRTMPVGTQTAFIAPASLSPSVELARAHRARHISDRRCRRAPPCGREPLTVRRPDSNPCSCRTMTPSGKRVPRMRPKPGAPASAPGVPATAASRRRDRGSDAAESLIRRLSYRSARIRWAGGQPDSKGPLSCCRFHRVIRSEGCSADWSSRCS
jgi:hypothetical protein